MKLNPEVADELIHKGFESPDLDYKLQFDQSTGAWMELAKDIYGMSNYGGGYIVFGVEDGTFKPIGLDEAFHIDAQEWVDKVSKWASGKISISYIEHLTDINGTKRKFPILYVHGSIGSFIIPTANGDYTAARVTKSAFRQGILYTRKNTSTSQASGDEFWQLFWSLLKRTAEVTGSSGTPLEVISALSKKAEPDNVEEALWFNLFPVVELPDLIHSADTDYRYPLDIYDRIGREPIVKDQKTSVPSFLLEDKKIYSFSEFDELNPLTLCINSEPTSFSTRQWLEDNTKHQKLVKLLNFNLKNLCRKRGFDYDSKRDRFYIKYFGGKPPEITWKPYKATSTRQLVYPRLSKNDGRLLYCEHFAGRLRFIVLGDGIYLTVEPIRVLTMDGVTPLDQRRNIRISTKKSFFYHNNNYLYDMKLWLHILAGNKEEIHLGHDKGKITVSILSIGSKVNFGIIDDQHTSEDFLDSLKSEPLEYLITNEEEEGDNPLTETSLEG